MSEFLLILGFLLMFWALIEGLWTTIWIDGNAAPLTSRFTTIVWKLFRLLFRRKNDRLLSLAGPFILSLTVFSWILFIGLGWTLMFYADPSSLKVPNNPDFIPQFTDAFWYVAYTMFTVGNGDFLPTHGFWQVISAFVAFTGMAMVTLSITYILQIISAANNKRSFANDVTGIGKTAEDFVIKEWTGKDFGAIELQLNSLSSQLAILNEQHLSFPILHYYHAARMEKSLDVAIAIFDDALSLIKHGMEEKNLPPETILSSARIAVDSFLFTVKRAFIKPASEVPPLPDLKKMRANGVPTISEEEFHYKINSEDERRKLILGLIQNGSWKWPKKLKNG